MRGGEGHWLPLFHSLNPTLCPNLQLRPLHIHYHKSGNEASININFVNKNESSEENNIGIKGKTKKPFPNGHSNSTLHMCVFSFFVFKRQMHMLDNSLKQTYGNIALEEAIKRYLQAFDEARTTKWFGRCPIRFVKAWFENQLQPKSKRAKIKFSVRSWIPLVFRVPVWSLRLTSSFSQILKSFSGVWRQWRGLQ